MLRARWAEGARVCIGLDSDFNKIPGTDHRPGNERNVDIANTIVAFNRRIVESTRDLVCAYKPNIAFYAAYGTEGLSALHRTIRDIHAIAPDVPVILDAKRADIDNTNLGYLKEAFDFFQADALTVHPYLGQVAMQPFLNCPEKGIIVLCRTSNEGSGEFQDPHVSIAPGCNMPFYQYVAHRVTNYWNKNGNCALVVGATYPEELAKVRGMVGNMPILIPGIGAQGGDVEQTVKAGRDQNGEGMIINSSRAIIFAEDPRAETEKLNKLIGRSR